MSAKAGTTAPKADADDTKWTPGDSANLLLLIMQEDNKDLAVKGWKIIGEKAKTVFNSKYTPSAVKHQFQKLRKNYLAECSTPEGGKNADGETAKTPTKGRKRTTTSTDSPDDEDGSSQKPKKARTTKATKRGKAVTEDATQDVYFEDSDELKNPRAPDAEKSAVDSESADTAAKPASDADEDTQLAEDASEAI
ncbi:hypothetical protein F5Y11DRAFT_364476 [Daldinia sp. FL1419]|nr:hypothetical protein F5Y11DRAFT_364476 [Daldinia sp. FL1419]